MTIGQDDPSGTHQFLAHGWEGYRGTVTAHPYDADAYGILCWIRGQLLMMDPDFSWSLGMVADFGARHSGWHSIP